MIWVSDHLNKGGPDYAYRVEMSPVEPRLTLSVANESLARGTGTIAVAVPKGNRQAILVNASRADFGGELDDRRQGLPAGDDVRGRPDGREPRDLPVLFTAKADAPVAARWRRSPASRSTPS